MVDNVNPIAVVQTRRKFLFGTAVAGGGALAGGIAYVGRERFVSTKRRKSHDPIDKPAAGGEPAATRGKALDRVDLCYKYDLEAVDLSFSSIDEFFAHAKRRAPEMVADLVDLGSAIKIVVKSLQDWLSGGKSTEEYVSRFLDAYLGMPKGLEDAFKAATVEIEQRWNANEQELYSGIEADLRTQQSAVPIDRVREVLATQMQAELHVYAANQGLIAASREVVVGLVLSGTAAAAMTRAMFALASRMGATAAAGGAAAATGAAAGPWTMGVSVIVGLIIAALIDYVAGKIQEAKATRDLIVILDEVHTKSAAEIRLAAAEAARAMRNGRRNGVFEIL